MEEPTLVQLRQTLLLRLKRRNEIVDRLRSELENLGSLKVEVKSEEEGEKPVKVKKELSHEAQILNRIAQLKKNSLWIDKKLAKFVAPTKHQKVHWDFVMEEMTWLSSVFQQEIKTKKFVSRKCAKMIQKHFSDKLMIVQRAEKAHELSLKKIASFMSKEIKIFWGNVEKLFEFRLKKQIEIKRKKALDEHLNIIVDKTEKYSNMLAESLIDNSVKTTPSVSDEDIEGKDYRPDQSSDDDEETIALDEKNHDNDKGEIDSLENESKLPIEEVLRQYYPEVYTNDLKLSAASGDQADSSNSSSVANDSSDDEESLSNLLDSDDTSFNNVIEMAAQFQPTGNTLATTTVKTPIPFILKHSLREYQHIGLDWLVTLHDRKLNGILADEMGLGKTIQTIAFLAHIACEKQLWGPHLIVVPTSVMLNWEMEIKKWAPSFKVLTYYGSQKERRLKRIGWTKPNAFHICITSYKLVVQDHQSFRRKKWYYFILDEAQHIKNFKSQRWQLLLNFQSSGRLLLTGTPLQNNLMELWSLMHFLMPNVFESHRDFKEWFSNPLTGMVEGSAEYNDGLVKRLHKVLRPFLLRRLKNEVEKQLPKKFEHIVHCPLSKRQRYLYDDFMSRAQTRETLEAGNFLSVINVLMQLRKVCNHPNLFEQRPTVSPFVTSMIDVTLPKLLQKTIILDPLCNMTYHPLFISIHEHTVTAFASHFLHRLKLRKLQEHLLPPCPVGKLKLTIQNDKCMSSVQHNQGFIPIKSLVNNNRWLQGHEKRNELTIRVSHGTFVMSPSPDIKMISEYSLPEQDLVDEEEEKEEDDVDCSLAPVSKDGIYRSSLFKNDSRTYEISSLQEAISKKKKQQLAQKSFMNNLKCDVTPLYGSDTINSLFFNKTVINFPQLLLHPVKHEKCIYDVMKFPQTVEDITERLEGFLSRFSLYIPKCIAIPKPVHNNFSNPITTFHQPSSQLQLPETRLIQYDCGKLQVLERLLHRLKSEGHRVLIFTQMTKILDVLETFLNYHGHIYLRLDGSTRIDQRQLLMEKFNGNKKYFCFILSTRSGGVGINLTGANTVIFYDSDWNPTMDAQAQDRCHRIGQTRDVHIYRLISEQTIEENILKKANQKRLLGDLAIEGGNFTTASLKKQTIHDLFNVNVEESDSQLVTQCENSMENFNNDAIGVFESAITAVEDETDIQALNLARKEVDEDKAEFDEEAMDKNEVDDQIRSLLDQLTAVEKYALSHIEFIEREWREQQLALADAEIEEQKQELNSKKIDELTYGINEESSEDEGINLNCHVTRSKKNPLGNVDS